MEEKEREFHLLYRYIQNRRVNRFFLDEYEIKKIDKIEGKQKNGKNYFIRHL